MAKYDETPDGDLRRIDAATGAVVDHGCARKHSGRRGVGFTVSKWSGRWALSLNAADVKVASRGLQIVNHPKHGECLEAEFVRTVKGRSRSEQHRFRDGSTEWEIVWDRKIDVPEFVDLLIDAPAGVTWHRQPELTPEEIDSGVIRPENVINSYAVYAPVSGRWLNRDGVERVNYETGKLMHVYRSWLEDSVGNRVWLDQTAPLGDPPRLRITIPAAAVAEMTPPITCGPTFGYESVGGATYNPASTFVFAIGPYSPAADGNATSLSLYTATSGVSVTLGLYADADGSPATLLKDSGGDTSIAGWTECSLDSALTISSASIYWLALAAGGSCGTKYDSVTNASCYGYNTDSTYNAGALKNPLKKLGDLPFRFSLYATYTEAGQPTMKRFGGVPFAAVNRGVW